MRKEARGKVQVSAWRLPPHERCDDERRIEINANQKGTSIKGKAMRLTPDNAFVVYFIYQRLTFCFKIRIWMSSRLHGRQTTPNNTMPYASENILHSVLCGHPAIQSISNKRTLAFGYILPMRTHFVYFELTSNELLRTGIRLWRYSV